MRKAAAGAMIPVALCTLHPAHAMDASAVVRAYGQLRDANDSGVLAPANEMLMADGLGLTTETELRGAAGPVSGALTWRHELQEGGPSSDHVVLNELSFNHAIADWYVTLGKKIVSWDVGFGFRPLDVVQQEDRRRLINTTTLEGVPLLMAEHYTSDASWSIVLINPHEDSSSHDKHEPALALRHYRHAGNADWYAVARAGTQSGWRGGLSVSFVATDSLEIHASALRAERLGRFIGVDPVFGAPTRYDVAFAGGGWQALIGFTWTNASRLSITGEAWRDERAWSSREWDQWCKQAATLASAPLPDDTRTALTAAQAQVFATPNLRRDNLLLQIAHTNGTWSPGADLLYTPEDGGVVLTGRLGWSGDRTSAEIGWRLLLGDAQAITRQLPTRQTLYVSMSLSF